MSCYLIENHQLQFNDGLSMLYVINTDNSEQVASFNLSSPYRLEVDAGDYKISSVSLPTGQYRQEFNVANEDIFEFQADAGIGISDLRTTRSQFEYHLAACPITMKFADGALSVYSPCTGACSQPTGACCTITTI